MKVILGILVLLLLAYTSMFDKITVPNERTRVYFAAALVDEHSVCIDSSVNRWGKTADIAQFEGRYYTDKAPGTGFLGAAVYGIARIFTPKDAWTAEALIRLMRIGLMIPVGLLGFVLLRKILFQLGHSRRIVDLSSIAWILGTAAFHYSTAFYGHQIAAVSTLLAVWLLLEGPNFLSKSLSALRLLGAGAAIGLAGLTEYQSIIPAVLLCVFTAAAYRRQPHKVAYFVAGALPFAASLLVYHKIAFHGFFELPYEHLASKNVQALHTKGIAGVGLPRAQAMFGSLLSLHRGLLTTGPIFLLVPFGIYRMLRDKTRLLALFVAVLFAYYLMFIFGADVWYAGWSFGPRLLVPVMGLAVIPIAAALQYLAKMPALYALSQGAVLWGILYNQAVHVVFPELPETATNPIFDVVVPALKKGVLSPNWAASLTGAPGIWTLIIPAIALTFVLYLVLDWNVGITFKKRAQYLALRFAIPAVLAAVICVTGPTWQPRQSDKFVRWMKTMERAQFQLDKPER